jgi:hypothetical protein
MPADDNGTKRSAFFLDLVRQALDGASGDDGTTLLSLEEHVGATNLSPERASRSLFAPIRSLQSE